MSAGLTQEQMAIGQRLSILTQRVGFALWQVQALEGNAATYFVLLAKAMKGMGLEQGQALVDAAKADTFGTIVKQLKKKNLIPGPLVIRFDKLVDERNWLAHRSRVACRAAIASGKGFDLAVARIQAIADEATKLNRELDTLIEKFVATHGITEKQIEQDAITLLEKWANGEV